MSNQPQKKRKTLKLPDQVMANAPIVNVTPKGRIVVSVDPEPPPLEDKSADIVEPEDHHLDPEEIGITPEEVIRRRKNRFHFRKGHKKQPVNTGHVPTDRVTKMVAPGVFSRAQVPKVNQAHPGITSLAGPKAKAVRVSKTKATSKK